ncbi:MAG: ABC transporter permease [Thermaerobacterales bacterium]
MTLRRSTDAADVQLPQAAAEDSPTMMQLVYRRFRRHRAARLALGVLAGLYMMAIFAPWIAPHSYSTVDTSNRFIAPSSEHWLGTDHLGRDVFSRIVWGARVSLSVGFVAAFFAVSIGTVVGAAAGYNGGRIDNILMRLTEIVMAFPVFFLLLTIVAVLPRSIFNIMLIIGLTSWPSLARVVRGQVLAVREMDFVEASRAAGVRTGRIIFRHVLPNVMAPIIVNATLLIGGAILAETALSYLGLGAPPPFPTWGAILSDGRGYMRNAPWLTTFPGVFIFVTVLAFNFVGDGLRDALDPKSKI